jgi:4-hydroxy-tetrahydrodipicolinate synthase
MKLLSGTGVAMITPFNKNKNIDYPALSKLIEYLIKGRVDFLVSMGTTGENSSLSLEEKINLLAFTKKTIDGRLPLILGLGGNNTKDVIKQLNLIDLNGVDALLSVSPAYNKPTQEGIYQHFKAISDATSKDIILYNVPSRTSSNITAKTTLRLANDFDNIIAIKEASGDLNQIMEILKEKPKSFSVLSGDDALTLPMIFMGASGVISVQAMAKPNEFSSMVRAGLSGQIDKALNLHYKQLDIINLIFKEGNPAGIKACLKIQDICDEFVRLPLVCVSKDTYLKIKEFY